MCCTAIFNKQMQKETQGFGEQNFLLYASSEQIIRTNSQPLLSQKVSPARSTLTPPPPPKELYPSFCPKCICASHTNECKSGVLYCYLLLHIQLLKAATQKLTLFHYWYHIQSYTRWYSRSLFFSSYSRCYCQLFVNLKVAPGTMTD